MRARLLRSIGAAAVITGAAVLLKITSVPVAGQTPTASAPAAAATSADLPRTAWGEPDLQGV